MKRCESREIKQIMKGNESSVKTTCKLPNQIEESSKNHIIIITITNKINES